MASLQEGRLATACAARLCPAAVRPRASACIEASVRPVFVVLWGLTSIPALLVAAEVAVGFLTLLIWLSAWVGAALWAAVPIARLAAPHGVTVVLAGSVCVVAVVERIYAIAVAACTLGGSAAVGHADELAREEARAAETSPSRRWRSDACAALGGCLTRCAVAEHIRLDPGVRPAEPGRAHRVTCDEAASWFCSALPLYAALVMGFGGLAVAMTMPLAWAVPGPLLDAGPGAGRALQHLWDVRPSVSAAVALLGVGLLVSPVLERVHGRVTESSEWLHAYVTLFERPAAPKAIGVAIVWVLLGAAAFLGAAVVSMAASAELWLAAATLGKWWSAVPTPLRSFLVDGLGLAVNAATGAETGVWIAANASPPIPAAFQAWPTPGAVPVALATAAAALFGLAGTCAPRRLRVRSRFR